MKRIITLILLLTVSIISLFACDISNNNRTTTDLEVVNTTTGVSTSADAIEPEPNLNTTTTTTVMTTISTTLNQQYDTGTEKPGHDLIFSDEFNGTTLDLSKWSYDRGTASWGWGNNEQQYYTDRTENVSVYDGALHIVARNESYGGMDYTSGRIHTSGKFDFKYGIVEARIALPSSNGMWPAFWMLGKNHPQVGWPSCGEIDIIEAINAENKVLGTNHWDNNGHASYGRKSGTFDITQYHTYRMTWDANYIRMYVDNVMYHDIDITGGKGNTEEFHKNFYFLLNVAVGGQLPGYNIDASAMPKTMLVDYIRVYQKN